MKIGWEKDTKAAQSPECHEELRVQDEVPGRMHLPGKGFHNFFISSLCIGWW